MNELKLDRRTWLKAATAIAATGLASGMGCAQTGARDSGADAKSLPGRGEFLIRGATILTMDAGIGDFVRGDVHVRKGAIVSVAREIAAPSATVIDAAGMICMPGFVDTHWHLWTSVLRPVIRIDDPRRGYQPVTNRLGQFYTPEDSYRSVRLGLAEGLSAGATTVHNWAHNIRSPAHADAELRAMRDTGLRGRLAYGTPMGYPNDQSMDLDGLAKIKREWMPNDGLLTLGISSRNVGDATNPLRGNISVETARTPRGRARSRCSSPPV
jgi:5-methylthioadenosine/S-adenosylhomocysteine deaminase